jgi:hypothetical protein
VFINGKGAHRMGDQNRHCGGLGQLVEGSPNVIVGEAAAAPMVQSAAAGRAGGSAGAGAGSIAPAAATQTPVPTPVAPRATPSGAGAIAASSTASPATAPPATEPPTTTRDEPTWFEIALVGEDGKGLSGERYAVILPDGAQRTGFLDEDGRTSFEDLLPGTCQVSFPDLDSEAWQPVDD